MELADALADERRVDVAGLRRLHRARRLVIHLLPIAGDGTAIVPAFLLAAFFNLVAVGVVARMAGWVVRRTWRPRTYRA